MPEEVVADEDLGEVQVTAPAVVTANEEFEVRVRLGRASWSRSPPLPLTVSILAAGARTRPSKHTARVNSPAPQGFAEHVFRLTAIDVGPGLIQVIIRQDSDLPLGIVSTPIEIAPEELPVDSGTQFARASLSRPDPALAALPSLTVDEEVSGGGSVLFVRARFGEESAEGSVRIADKGRLIASIDENVAAFRSRSEELPAQSSLLTRTADSLARVLLPGEVRALLWRMREALDGLLFLTNGELDLAWELVGVTPPSGEPEDGPVRLLGESGMVRWLYGVKHPSMVDISSQSVVAITPRYENALSLEFAGDEVRLLTSTFGVRPITRIDPARMSKVVKGGWALFHFAGHGGQIGGPGAPWSLLLSDPQGGVDSPTGYSEADLLSDLSTSEATAGNTGGPVVVLNTSVPARVPAAVVRSGAAVCIGQSALLADDRAASAFVEAFYGALIDGQTLGDATRIGRRLTRETHRIADPGFVVYGNPLLRIQLDGEEGAVCSPQ